jgi:hypothetical protein
VTEAGPAGPESICPLAAIATERLHGVLRRMSDDDWARLKARLCESLTDPHRRSEVDVLERVFRQNEAVAGHFGGAVFRLIQAMMSDPLLRNEVRKAHEQLRSRVRVVLREMSDRDWRMFKDAMERAFSQPTRADDIRILELVCRVGESISNVEIAAQAKADKVSGRKWIEPEVARKNALLKARLPGAAQTDPEGAYSAAARARKRAQETAQRGEHTVVYSLVEPTAPYRHARNSVFKLVDAIVENQELMSWVSNIERDLAAVEAVSREKMRWALHRMPMSDRMRVIKLIPLNTVLAFQEPEDQTRGQDASFRAVRDRRLAHDLFVLGQSEEELMVRYRFSLPALKSAVAVILEALVSRPLARKLVNEYLARVGKIEPMASDDVRRAMKRLTAEQRAAIVNRIPACAWKARDVMPVHKGLFLDYLSGEWVLGALVAHYNLRGEERLSGIFRRGGTLTVRGAGAAIEGLHRKIADEPTLRQQLKHWALGLPTGESLPASVDAEPEEAQIDYLIPVAHATRPCDRAAVDSEGQAVSSGRDSVG